MAKYDEFPHTVDVMGQLPLLKAYTHLLLAFKLPSQKTPDSLIHDIEAALHKVTSSFPWLSGSVINTSASPGNSGIFRVIRTRSWTSTQIEVRDLSALLPSFDDIVNSRGPSSVLDGSLVSPRSAFPDHHGDDPAPVLSFQLSLVKEGVLMNCAAQHNMLDMSGIGQVLRLLAQAMRDEEFSAMSLEAGNCDRSKLVPLLAPGETRFSHEHMRLSPPAQMMRAHPGATVFSPASAWHYFRFSASKQAQLKQAATSTDRAAPFVSSDDSLGAFLWQKLSQARLESLGSQRKRGDTPTKCCRAVDCRRALHYRGRGVQI